MKRIKPLLPIMNSFSAYSTAYGALDSYGRQGMLIEFVGESGSGKTTIANHYIEKHPNTHRVVCSSTMGAKDMMQKIAGCIGVHLSGNAYKFQEQLTSELTDRAEHSFILDECEYLSKNNIDKLDTVRQIWDVTTNTFIFCGTYRLRKILIGNSSDPESEFSQIYRRMKKVKMKIVEQAEFYDYLDLIEKLYLVNFEKEVRNTLYSYAADAKHGGLGISIDIIKDSFNAVRPEWISISSHLAHSPDTAEYFPDYYRLRKPDADLSCYDPNAVYISPENIAKLKPVEISNALIRSVSKYHIVV